ILLAAALTGSAVGAGCSASWLTGGEEVPNVQAPAPPPAPVVIDGVRTSYADVVEKTAAAVVRIEAEARNERQQAPQGRSPLEDFFRQFPGPGGGGQGPRVERGMGSGVIVSADGTLLTNAHVIDGAQTIRVLTNDNRSYDAKLVGIDKPSDLAVLKIDAQNTPFLNLGNSD